SALDPLFQDAAPTGPIVFGAPPEAGGVPPMPPVLLTPSSTLGETTVTNSGNGDAYPVWTITGPGVPTLTNVTTGREFSLAALSEGEVVTVDTRPTLQSAVDQLGNDRWGDLVKESPRDLWTLVPGRDVLNLALESAEEGSQVSMVYHRRWLRAGPVAVLLEQLDLTALGRGAPIVFDKIDATPTYNQAGPVVIEVPANARNWELIQLDSGGHLVPFGLVVNWGGVYEIPVLIEDWSFKRVLDDGRIVETLTLTGADFLAVLANRVAYRNPAVGWASQTIGSTTYGPDPAETVIKDIITAN